MSSGVIVVGVDGSPESRHALRWAAEEARQRGARLRVVHAWTLPAAIGVADAVLGHPVIQEPPLDELKESLAQEAERVLDDALVGFEDIEIEREVVEASPARALLRAAEGADLVVVGSRGRGGFTGLLLGSVSQQCAHHAPCPVVIVRSRPAD